MLTVWAFGLRGFLNPNAVRCLFLFGVQRSLCMHVLSSAIKRIHHISQSRLVSGRGFQVKVFKIFQGFPSSIGCSEEQLSVA